MEKDTVLGGREQSLEINHFLSFTDKFNYLNFFYKSSWVIALSCSICWFISLLFRNYIKSISFILVMFFTCYYIYKLYFIINFEEFNTITENERMSLINKIITNLKNKTFTFNRIDSNKFKFSINEFNIYIVCNKNFKEEKIFKFNDTNYIILIKDLNKNNLLDIKRNIII